MSPLMFSIISDCKVILLCKPSSLKLLRSFFVFKLFFSLVFWLMLLFWSIMLVAHNSALFLQEVHNPCSSGITYVKATL